MEFRNINIPKIVYQILRPNYAIRRDTVNGKTTLSLSDLFRFIVCCLMDAEGFLDSYETERRRNYMIAACMPVQGQVTRVLNELYGQYGAIVIDPVTYQSVYLYDAASSTAANRVYLYTNDQNKPFYLGYPGAAANKVVVTIPAALRSDTKRYSDFIATLNSLIVYGVNYEIQTQ